MKKVFILPFLTVFLIIIYFSFAKLSYHKNKEEALVKQSNAMTISSAAFRNNSPIPSKYSCEGDNISPPLFLKNVPSHAKSLTLLVEDPDAPTGLWVHWVVINIPLSVRMFEEGKAPEGAVEGINSSDTKGYQGPCPPSGTHRYLFKLYAL